jgi:23S rRNA (pseudouridine1915-N3)-methyltransferase
VKIQIIAVGHKMPDWVDSAFKEYSKRLSGDLPTALIEIKPDKRLQGRSVEKNLEIERDRILSSIPPHSLIVVLDERGKNPTTRQLAQMLEKWQHNGQDVTFIIGSADGLHDDIKSRAGYTLALSSMTLPHGLARVILIEQLYRAISIIRNHPYHRE